MDSNQDVDETSPAPQGEPAAAESAAPAPEPVAAPVETSEPELPLGVSAPEHAPAAESAPATEPTPAAPEADVPAEVAVVPFDGAELTALAEKAAGKRLPAPDEARAADLVTAGLLAGKDEAAVVAAALPAIGWTAGVKGVAAAWPRMKATARTAFMKAVGAEENEAARRVRLSLARGLFAMDPAACSKLAVGVAKEIHDKKSGEMGPKDAQTFAAVMIGKGKPWIAQIPLAEHKPADADALIHCAVLSVFSTNNPPVTQLGVLKWAAEAGRLGELHESALAAVTKSAARWSPRWATAARAEVPNLPEAIAAVLKADAPPQERPERQERASGLPPGLEDDADGSEIDDEGTGESGAEGNGDNDSEGAEGTAEGGEQKPKERPVYVSKTVPPRDSQAQRDPRDQRQGQQQQGQRGPGPKSGQFNATDALRQVESHIGWLRAELQAAEKKARTREERPRKPDVPVIEGAPTPEELARLNVQLEARISELQARIDDLTADAEARATSRGAFADGPAPDAGEQLRTLLGMKLRDYYADFCALEKEDRDLVVPQHFRTVLADVFEVLKAESIALEEPPPTP